MDLRSRRACALSSLRPRNTLTATGRSKTWSMPPEYRRAATVARELLHRYRLASTDPAPTNDEANACRLDRRSLRRYGARPLGPAPPDADRVERSAAGWLDQVQALLCPCCWPCLPAGGKTDRDHPHSRFSNTTLRLAR